MGMNKSTFAPVNLTLTNSQKGYIAGIIDGEGYVGVLKAKKDKHMRPVVSIENTSELLINYLIKTTGLAIKYKKMRKNSKPNHRQIWSFTVRKFSEIKALCEAVLPCLVIKRKNTQLILELLALREESYKKRMMQIPRDDHGRLIKPPSMDYSQRELEIYRELRVLNNHGTVN